MKTKLSAVLLIFCSSILVTAEPGRPNILFIITDDQDGGDRGSAQPIVPTNLLSQIKFECLSDDPDVERVWIGTVGYIDSRGKDL